MENQLLKVITDSKVEQSTALSLQNAFLPFYDNLLVWSEKAKTLVVTHKSQTREMKMAREGRLALKDIRVAANKTRIALKEDSTRYGKAVQSVYNLIEGLITPAEKHLEEQEKFVEIQEANCKAELKAIRSAELLPYAEFVEACTYPILGEYTEKEYTSLLNSCKELLEINLAEKAQAELDRTAKEKEKVERQGKMFESGFKFSGDAFVYKTARYHLPTLLSMSSEGFEEVLTIAKTKKEQIDLEDEQALAKIAELKNQTANFVVTIPPVIPTPAPLYQASEVNQVKPSFHCFLCGAKLSEIGPYALECDDCLTSFIHFLSVEDNQCLKSLK